MRYSPVRRSPPGSKLPVLPLDLHVLGLPPAFNLSHDQTLQLQSLRSLPSRGRKRIKLGSSSNVSNMTSRLSRSSVTVHRLVDKRPHELPDRLLKSVAAGPILPEPRHHLCGGPAAREAYSTDSARSDKPLMRKNFTSVIKWQSYVSISSA